jgi:hypothetical protein
MKIMKEIIMVILTTITTNKNITTTTEVSLEIISKGSKMTSVRLAANLITMDIRMMLKTMPDRATTTSNNLDTMMVVSIKKPSTTHKHLAIILNLLPLLRITLHTVFPNLVLTSLLKLSLSQPHKHNSWTSKMRRKLSKNLMLRMKSRHLPLLPLSYSKTLLKTLC